VAARNAGWTVPCGIYGQGRQANGCVGTGGGLAQRGPRVHGLYPVLDSPEKMPRTGCHCMRHRAVVEGIKRYADDMPRLEAVRAGAPMRRIISSIMRIEAGRPRGLCRILGHASGTAWSVMVEQPLPCRRLIDALVGMEFGLCRSVRMKAS